MNEIKLENVALIYIELPDSNPEQDLYELKELISTAQGQIRLEFTQKRTSLDANTVVGSGKAEEIKRAIEMCENDNPVDLAVFSCQLNATQRKNLKKALDCDVIDKIDLILDIFALRATSAEGKKQVELAQLSYNLATRPEGSNLSRQGAGIGTRGPGETKLETNKRVIRDKITRLKRELKEIESRRNVTRKKRNENNMFTVALVGYTNAGKSTLFNAITQADVYADNKLFATLDTTVRNVMLPDGLEFLLCDTVGFLNDLPHALLNAFKSTLEEAATANLLLNVCDISDENVANHIKVTEETLLQLGVDAPIIRVFNKCDKQHPAALEFADINSAGTASQTIFVSALTGKNLDVLLYTIGEYVRKQYAVMKLKVSHADSAKLLSRLNKLSAQIKDVAYFDDYVVYKTILPRKHADSLSEYITF